MSPPTELMDAPLWADNGHHPPHYWAVERYMLLTSSQRVSRTVVSCSDLDETR